MSYDRKIEVPHRVLFAFCVQYSFMTSQIYYFNKLQKIHSNFIHLSVFFSFKTDRINKKFH